MFNLKCGFSNQCGSCIKYFTNTHHEAATCDMSGLSNGYGYWLVGNEYIDGLGSPNKNKKNIY